MPRAACWRAIRRAGRARRSPPMIWCAASASWRPARRRPWRRKPSCLRRSRLLHPRRWPLRQWCPRWAQMACARSKSILARWSSWPRPTPSRSCSATSPGSGRSRICRARLPTCAASRCEPPPATTICWICSRSMWPRTRSASWPQGRARRLLLQGPWRSRPRPMRPSPMVSLPALRACLWMKWPLPRWRLLRPPRSAPPRHAQRRRPRGPARRPWSPPPSAWP